MEEITDAHDYAKDLRKRNRSATHDGIRTTSVKIPPDILEYYDGKVALGMFPSRSEAIRYYLRYHKDLEEKK